MSNYTEHDFTKKILKTIRDINKLTESDIPTTTNGENEIKVLENGEKINGELYDYYTKDSEQLINLLNDISFNNYIVYPNKGGSGDVYMDGKLNAYDITFRMNKDNSLNLRIETNGSITLDDNVMDSLNKLKSFYTNWQKEWALELNKESFKNLI